MEDSQPAGSLPDKVLTARPGQGQIQEPEVQSRPPPWVAGGKDFKPHHCPAKSRTGRKLETRAATSTRVPTSTLAATSNAYPNKSTFMLHLMRLGQCSVYSP